MASWFVWMISPHTSRARKQLAPQFCRKSRVGLQDGDIALRTLKGTGGSSLSEQRTIRSRSDARVRLASWSRKWTPKNNPVEISHSWSKYGIVVSRPSAILRGRNIGRHLAGSGTYLGSRNHTCRCTHLLQ